MKWYEINWQKANNEVKTIQKQIVEAYLQNNMLLLKKLQWKLIRSFACRALAVRKCVTNSGRKSPGVDGEIWDDHDKRWQAIEKLQLFSQNSKHYKAAPVKRVWIQKENGESRALGIPTMIDRAFQAMHLFATDPIVESQSDHHSYGFRQQRSPHNAIAKIWDLLNKENSPRWILDADIKGCFDNINHEFLLQVTPMCDLEVLEKWLKAGILEDGNPFPSEIGAPQGSIISPLLANIALNGLESITQSFPTRKMINGKRTNLKIHAIRFADDFIFTAEKEQFLFSVKEKITQFLAERGLWLNENKTQIINVNQGFTFLGFHISKQPRSRKRRNLRAKGKEIVTIKISKKNKLKFRYKIKRLLKSIKNPSQLITQLNPITRGWANYFKIHTHSTKDVRETGAWFWRKVWQWCRKKHRGRNAKWIARRYYRVDLKGKTKRKTASWLFSTPENRKSKLFDLQVQRISKLYLYRIPKDFNPYLQTTVNQTLYNNLLSNVSPSKKAIFKKQLGLCTICGESLFGEQEVEIDHKISKKSGGKNSLDNFQALHRICHQQKTNRDRKTDLYKIES